jgi:FG-GAP-like repeat
VNGDGHPDILVSNAVHAFSVLLNSGTGTFPTYTKYPACPYPAYAVGLADLQNNGQVDMTVTNYSCSLISSSWGNGDGTFQTAPTYFTVGLNPDALAIADFNKDGNLDMVVLNEKAHTASILMQSGLAQHSLSPNGINFGPIQGGFKSAPQTVTITNTTGSALALSKVVLAGANPAQFTESNNCPSSLGSGASCTATVVFAPLAAENFYANLAVVDPVGIQVAAFAGSGRLSFSMVPDAMTFPRTQVGQDSAPQTAVITNESGLLLVFSSITMQGADPADFSQTNNCPVSPSGLGPGQQCTITVEETPQMAGNLFATVVVLSNGSTPRRAIALTGSAYN